MASVCGLQEQLSQKSFLCMRTEKFVVLNPYRITINAIKYQNYYSLYDFKVSCGVWPRLIHLSLSLCLCLSFSLFVALSILFPFTERCSEHLQFCVQCTHRNKRKKKKLWQNVYVLLSFCLFTWFFIRIQHFYLNFQVCNLIYESFVPHVYGRVIPKL